MTKVKPVNKEQLIYYLLQNISLGTYDKKFLENLQATNLNKKKPITSNQSDLLNKITMNYFKQLKRKEIDATEMTLLPWTLEPIDSLPEYTDAFCTIKDDIIEVRTPYNKEFIQDFKKTILHLEWHRDTKTWSTVFCELALKHIIDCLDNHFTVVRYCKKTVALIEKFAEYESIKYWNPTLKNVNGNFMIVASNSHVDNAIKDIELSTDPKTISLLKMYGITIEIDIDKTSSLEQLALSDVLTRSYNDIEDTIIQLKELGCDFILICDNSFAGASERSFGAVRSCKKHQIPYETNSRTNKDISVETKNYKFPALLNIGLWITSRQYFAKIIHFGNSTPIDIK